MQDPVVATTVADDRKTFHHEPLDHAKASIRLLQILPELTDEGHVQCQLRHYDLYAHIPDGSHPVGRSPVRNAHRLYTCLSYTWGDSSRTCPIMINDGLYFVHQNLQDFLQYARRQFDLDGGLKLDQRLLFLEPFFIRKPLLWIDAICINQSDVTEKNHQVQQMGEIYSTAALVLMWLGKACSPSSLHRSEYWTRAWITQEVVLARHHYICLESGIHQLSRLEQEIANEDEENINDQPIWTCDSDRAAADSYSVLSAYVQGRVYPQTIVKALDSFGVTKCCTNILDRIYSLLALVPDHNITVDYNISRGQLLEQVLMSCGTKLCFCGATIPARALEIAYPVLDIPAEYRIEIELPKYFCVLSDGKDWDKCARCRRILPEPCQQEVGFYFCLHDICETMRGHLFVHVQRDAAPAPNGIRSPVHASKATHILDSTHPRLVTGVEIQPGCIPGKFPKTVIWRFTINALLEIAAIENEGDDQRAMRVCYKTTFCIDIGGPLAIRKMRPCSPT
jgi:hypothetical protein